MLLSFIVSSEPKKSRERKSAEKSCTGSFYVTEVVCDNCSKAIVMTILKGTTVEEMAIKALCPNCACSLWEDPEDHDFDKLD
jgi:uncharacterized protein CbrC (UPF0167 family)